MSTSHQVAGPSTDTFTAIFNAAATKYYNITGKRLESHPLSAQLGTCRSPEAISSILRTQAQAFSQFCKADEKLMAWLDPTVNILFTFSATLGGGIGLPFSPATTIFTGVGVLLGAVRDVSASHDAVIHLFERIHFFLQRLIIYIGIPLTNDLTALLGNVMAHLLVILALSTKVMTDGRMKKIVKRLVGKKDVEDALEKLDVLTREEISMTVARNLKVSHDVDGNVAAIKEAVHSMDGNVMVIKDVIGDIDSNVKQTEAFTEAIDANVKTTKALTEEIGDDVKVIDHNVRVAKHTTDELKRNQSQEKLRTWLSPPDPSINHNTAYKTQHNGTATWFIQGNTFREWKQSGSLLWIRGNPGAGKSVLCSAIVEDVKNMRRTSSTLIAYYYFDFKDTCKRGLHGLLTSLLFQLGDDDEDCRDILYDLYKTCRDGSEQPSDATLVKCLETMLDLLGQLPIFIIIDALDECPSYIGTPSAREEVLDFVEKLVESNHSNLFLCITSRPEQDIQTALNPLTSAPYRVSLHEEVGQREDIKSYVQSFVHKDREMRRWREEDRELVIMTLCERAHGM
ncbi:hypothetical protein BC827DRAFT_912226 [Russula dissimulans]|nr:hypothetical protein BC827DRAFT_912226 [Russula dissimulans]